MTLYSSNDNSESSYDKWLRRVGIFCGLLILISIIDHFVRYEDAGFKHPKSLGQIKRSWESVDTCTVDSASIYKPFKIDNNEKPTNTQAEQ